MQDLIKEIVIVGGGTSGWLSAVFLHRALNKSEDERCRITLIESSDIGTIGVGEATIPTIRRTLRFCGIDETDWMLRCNATFKLAIKFVDWSGAGGVYWHPFGPLSSVGGVALSHHWLKRNLLGDAKSFDHSCFPVIPSCEAKRAPKRPRDQAFEGVVPYAYHLDAGLLATYLRELGTRRGVQHVIDDVVDVELDDRGYVRHVRTKKGAVLRGDLFIDCTGFAGLIINRALGEPFESFSDALLCDRAIAIPVPTDAERNAINPYTTARALSAGWAWHIPLFNRDGNGYVYSGAFTSPDEAEAELRGRLGPQSQAAVARHIKMRVGKTRNAWVNNCVAIGLSGGFIEPLESTAIFFIELGLFNLITHFPDLEFRRPLIERYNTVINRHYNEIRDFVLLHYCTTQREDTPFWRANKYHNAIPHSLRSDLALWLTTMPNHGKLDEPRFFKDYSYCAILAGMGTLPYRSLPFLEYGFTPDSEDEFRRVEEEGASLAALLPDHYGYIAGLHDDHVDWTSEQKPGSEKITITFGAALPRERRAEGGR